MITPQEALLRCIEHREIFHDEMLHLMRLIMRGELSPVMTAAIVTGLRVKKETIGEISAAAQVMREFSNKVNVHDKSHLVDIVGTDFVNRDMLHPANKYGYTLLQTEVTGFERDKKQVRTAHGLIEYDFLILSGGIRNDYEAWFGNDQRAIDYIRKQMTPTTKALITGYADRSGDEDLNLRLTTERANSVAGMLNAPRFEAKGVGKSQLLFDNNLPEGRFYSRTVNIVLEKPINQ